MGVCCCKDEEVVDADVFVFGMGYGTLIYPAVTKMFYREVTLTLCLAFNVWHAYGTRYVFVSVSGNLVMDVKYDKQFNLFSTTTR